MATTPRKTSDVGVNAGQVASAGEQPRDLDVYVLFGGEVDDAVGATAGHQPEPPTATQETNAPRITIVPRLQGYEGEGVLLPPTQQSQGGDAVHLDSSGERPFGGGICRQLAAMYTDVGMTTVERVRWHCGCMTLLYLLTSFAWFSWPVYMVPAVGMFTGIVGLLSCLRPHERRFLSYVLSFLALNFAQMALLCWVLFVTVAAQLAAACGDDGCTGVEAKTVLLLVLVMGTAGLHWHVANLTRHYIREFRMIEQLEIQGRRPRPSVSVAASSTMATELHSSYSASGASASAVSVAVEVNAPPSVTSSAAYRQVTRL
ncbi:hypothetical protein BBJ28_00000515 [Nothophytophthora sp. Chile5]|nr:hypothetical protein BBJ28_00000515 [Nothophytophthora sp. Chile5]